MTNEEKKWLRKFQKLMDECPSQSFEAYTVGDSDICIFDASKLAKIIATLDADEKMDFCTAVEENNASICNIDMPFPVHSTAG